jgi:organic hydroperoxide reductase OsmC/OhrA
MTDSVSLNGVDLARIGELKAQFKENPDSSRVGFTASVRWLGGFRTESTMTNHSIVRGDEPTVYAGQDSGPSPEDMLLAAVGQCLAVGYASTTAARGIALRSLEIEVRGKVNFMVAYGPRCRQSRVRWH